LIVLFDGMILSMMWCYVPYYPLGEIKALKRFVTSNGELVLAVWCIALVADVKCSASEFLTSD
jgi:Zn-finger protein